MDKSDIAELQAEHLLHDREIPGQNYVSDIQIFTIHELSK
jgi:hypothetical protein